MTVVFGHILAAYALVVGPLLSCRKLRELRSSDAAIDRTRLYRRAIAMQAGVCAALAIVCFLDGMTLASLGFVAPRSWWLTVGLGGAFVGGFAYAAVRQRSKAAALRERLRVRGGMVMLPDTREELRWFTIMAGMSGPAEESVYRGFLFLYISLCVPRVHTLELVLLTALLFGLGHAYQGWRGIASTALAGVLFGTLYAVSGSLLLPAVVHSAGNLQGAVILWPGSDIVARCTK